MDHGESKKNITTEVDNLDENQSTDSNNIRQDNIKNFSDNVDDNSEKNEFDNNQETNNSIIDSLKLEINNLEDKLLRLAAEMDNYRKRNEREKYEYMENSNKRLIKDLLPTLDNLERAILVSNVDNIELLLNGIILIHQEFFNILGTHGLSTIETSNKEFSPELHEAVSQQNDNSIEDNIIIKELQKGYLLKDKLLRPSMVIVNKNNK